MKASLAEVLATALRDAGVRVVTHVPGHGASEAFAAFRALAVVPPPQSYHEEVAYTIAHGAALVGTRAATLIKAHGLAKAANSALDSLAAGTTAGCLALVFDDRAAKSSDSVFDIATLVKGIGIPYRQAGDDPYRDVLDAFEASEQTQLPHVLLVDADAIDAETACAPAATLASPPPSRRNVPQHFVGPLFAAHQYRVLSAKRRGEDWRAVPPPALPGLPDGLPEVWQARIRPLIPLFEVFRTLRGPVVTGDTSTPSLFALPPYDCVDLVTYMGGSIPLAVGACLAGYEPVWALTGDFSFLAAGHLGLVEAVQRSLRLKVLVFDNGVAAATGGQPVPTDLLDHIRLGYGRYIRHLRDPRDPAAVRAVLAEAAAASELRVIVADYRSA